MTKGSLTEAVVEIVEQWRHKQGPLLPILHAVQARFAHIPSDAIPIIAKHLSLSRAEVHGVVSFYHDFSSQPKGRHVVQVCRAEACQAMGSHALEDHVKNSLGLDWGETSSDGALTLEPVYCLGNCACSPSVRVNNTIYARVSPDRFDEIVSSLEDHADH